MNFFPDPCPKKDPELGCKGICYCPVEFVDREGFWLLSEEEILAIEDWNCVQEGSNANTNITLLLTTVSVR